MFLGLRSRPAPVSQGLKTPGGPPPRPPVQAAWVPWRDRTHHRRGAGGHHPVQTQDPGRARRGPRPSWLQRFLLILHTSAHTSPRHPPGCHRAREAHLRVALPGQGVALQAGAHGNVGKRAVAAATLDGDAGGLGADSRGRDHDARDLHQVGHCVRLQQSRREGAG